MLPLQNTFPPAMPTAADGRGVFGVSFGNQSGYSQVHEAGDLKRQQNAENHTDFCSDERVGDGYGETRIMAFEKN